MIKPEVRRKVVRWSTRVAVVVAVVLFAMWMRRPQRVVVELDGGDAVAHYLPGLEHGIQSTFHTQNLLVDQSSTTGTLTINTNGQSALFSTFVGPDSAGENIWIGGGGQSSTGAPGFPAEGAGNVSMGHSSMLDLTIGNDNTAVGDQAMRNTTTGGDNTAIGRSSMQFSTTARQNTCLGVNTCEDVDGLAGLGWNNVAVGLDALETMTSGFRNVAIGADVLPVNLTGNSNVCVGDQSCNVATDSNNTALGGIALRNLTTGDKNTALGHASGGGITTGRANTIVGNATGLAAGLSNNIILADGDGVTRLQCDSTGIWSTSGSINIGSSSGTDKFNIKSSATQLTLETTNTPSNKLTIHNSGTTIWDLDPIPGAGTDNQSIRLFRHTVTSGVKDLCITAGNATSCNTDIVGTVSGGATQSAFANGLQLVSVLNVIIPTGPTFDNGTPSADSTASAGADSTVGATTANMSVTTLTSMTVQRAFCVATPQSNSPQLTVMTAALVATPCTGTCHVLFSCFNATTGVAANCPDFSYHCQYGL